MFKDDCERNHLCDSGLGYVRAAEAVPSLQRNCYYGLYKCSPLGSIAILYITHSRLNFNKDLTSIQHCVELKISYFHFALTKNCVLSHDALHSYMPLQIRKSDYLSPPPLMATFTFRKEDI